LVNCYFNCYNFLSICSYFLLYDEFLALKVFVYIDNNVFEEVLILKLVFIDCFDILPVLIGDNLYLETGFNLYVYL